MAGLDRTMLLPVGRGYIEGSVGYMHSTLSARVEAGWHPLAQLALFGFAETGTRGPMAGAGARYLF